MTTEFEKKEQELQVRRAVETTIYKLSSAFRGGLAIAADEAARLALAGRLDDAVNESVRLGVATAAEYSVRREPPLQELNLLATIFRRLGYDRAELRDELLDTVVYVLRACGAEDEAAKLRKANVEGEGKQ